MTIPCLFPFGGERWSSALALAAFLTLLFAAAPATQTLPTWEKLPSLREPGDPPTYDRFNVVAFSGDTVVVGTDNEFAVWNHGEGAWATDRALSGSVHYGVATTSGSFFAGSKAGAFSNHRTTDLGYTWEAGVANGPASAPFQSTLPALRNDQGHGALFYSTGVSSVRSDDDGREGSWVTQVPMGGDGEAFGDVPPSAALPDGRLLAAVWNGITYSDDGGESWQASSLYGPARAIATSLAFRPEPGHPFGGAAFAGVDDLALPGRDSTATVWRSDDGGATWAEVWRPSPAAFGLDGANHVEVFVDAEGVVWGGIKHIPGGNVEQRGAIARSLDGGATWHAADARFERWAVRAFAVGPDGRLYAGTDGGLWRTTAPVVEVSEVGAPAARPEAVSVAVSPNPAGGAARVTVELGEPAVSLSVSVVDALGRRVAVLHEGPAAAGALALDVATAELAPGLYAAVARTSGGVVSVRFTAAR